MAITFRITTNDFSQAQRAVDDKIRQVLEQCGENIEGHAKEDCPVDTGLLRNSITYALSGESISYSYHAEYGENRYKSGKKSGQRRKATSKLAGEVGVGRANGIIGRPEDNAVFVGTNVDYATYVELRDSAHHTVGKAHFLRDAGTTHIDELQEIASAILRTV